jgi:putative ABC transport system permease protein
MSTSAAVHPEPAARPFGGRGRFRVSRFPAWFAAAEGVRSALHSIRAHSFRSFLTALGIIIGVASVIAMVSIIQGLSYTIGQQFQGLGSNSVILQSYTPLEDRLQGRRARITQDDYDLITYRVDGIESITPVMFSQTGQSQVRYGSQAATAQILGTTYSFQEVGQYYTLFGRFLSDSDNQTRRRVAVIGEDVRDDLSLPENPVGEFIQVNGEWLKVIGLLEPKGEILGQSQDNRVLLPFSAMQSLTGNEANPDIQIQLAVADVTQMDAMISRIGRLLRDAHHLAPGAEDDFRIQTAEQLTDSFETILTNVTVVMAGIVGISLLVGGIGIMNIMLVSVTERTREIGIRLAIGALENQVLTQFLVEAVALSLFGGITGIVLGLSLGFGAVTLLKVPFVFSPMMIAVAFLFSAAIGMIFGYFPARRAAQLNPIEALRHE